MPEQVVRRLRQADGLLADGADVAAVCRDIGVSEQPYYRWRNQYGRLADDAKRLKELEKQKRHAEAAAGRGGAREGRAEGSWRRETSRPRQTPRRHPLT